MLVRIRATPNASRSAIVGWFDDPAAGRLLHVRIAAPPVDGKANSTLIEFLARALDLPKSQVRLVKGAGSRIKTVELPDATRLPTDSRLP
jgi:hypothetical protein